MSVKRRLMKMGGSKVISLPRSWIRNHEEEMGQPLKAVALEVSGIIKVYPHFEKSVTELSGEKDD